MLVIKGKQGQLLVKLKMRSKWGQDELSISVNYLRLWLEFAEIKSIVLTDVLFFTS
jgi:hypothetical protein